MPDFETLNDALIECVKAAGGSKHVGNKVWPEKTIDAAQRHLLNCLNEGKAERLTPEQTLLVAKLARAKGCHAYAEFMAADLGYAKPVPVTPRDEVSELKRQFIESSKSMAAIAARIEQLLEAQ